MTKPEITKICGKSGAESILTQLPADSGILLLDESAAIVWMARRDAAGMPTLLPFDISPHIEKPPVDFDAIENRLTKLEEFIYEYKSHTGGARRKPKPKPAAEDSGSDIITLGE